jgi:small subunit ribosomal protein S17
MIERSQRKTRVGVVVSNKAEKTAIVSVQRQIMHAKYGKIVRMKKKYVAHDEKKECQIGDTVKIMETRPLSKTKRWRVCEVLEKVQ